MKHFILISILCTFKTTLSAQTAKVDTVVHQIWNGADWKFDSRTISTYDANCRLSNILTQQWNETSQIWDNESLMIYNYQSDNYFSDIVTQTWDISTSSWINSSRTVYTYDGSFKLLSLNSQAWDNNTWTDFYDISYSYDNNGYYDSVLIKNTFFGPLENSILSIYTNNSDGTPSQVTHQFWVVSEWQNSYRETFTYNTDKSVSQLVNENWISNSWQYGSRITYTYNSAGKLLTTLTESAYPSPWVNSSQNINTYDGNNFLTNTLNKTWNTATNSWDNESQINFTNNTDGTVHISVHQKWNTTTSTWDNDYEEISSYSTSCTLPLKLISFTASKNKNIVTLNWQTAEEINTSHFNIQRSIDGVNFGNVGNVTAKGRDGQSYSFSDNIDNIKGDKVYYRLQMMDKDGRYSFSKIIPLTLEIFAGNIKTYPNPVKDQLYILFNAQNATKATIRISDASGKIVHTETVSTTATAMNVNVSRLGKGVYYVQLITDKGVQRTTFMKQ